MNEKLEKLLEKGVYFKSNNLLLNGTIKEIKGEIDKDLTITCLVDGKEKLLSFYNCFTTSKLTCVNKEDNDLALEICDYIRKNEIMKNDSERILEEARKKTKSLNIKPSNPKKITKKNYLRNAAYKAIYCDGKFDNPNGEWFMAPCSKERMEKNCSKKGDNCCNCSICKDYVEGRATKEELLSKYNSRETGAGCICYESNLFRDWIVRAGRILKKDKAKGWKVEEDSIVFITTLKPGDAEIYRSIVGAFLVKNSFDKDADANKEAYCEAHEKYRIMTKSSDKSQVLFWKFIKIPDTKGPIWNRPLIRYVFTDKVAAAILKELVEHIKTYKDKEQTKNAEEFLNYFVKTRKIDINNLSKPSDTLIEWI